MDTLMRPSINHVVISFQCYKEFQWNAGPEMTYMLPVRCVERKAGSELCTAGSEYRAAVWNAKPDVTLSHPVCASIPQPGSGRSNVRAQLSPEVTAEGESWTRYSIS